MKYIKNFTITDSTSIEKMGSFKPDNASFYRDTDEKTQISVQWNEEEGTFSFQNLQNETLWAINAPICYAKLAPELKNVWLVERKNQEQVIVWLYDYEGKPKASLEMEDVIYQSYFSLQLLPEPHKISLEMAGGQDGCRTYFLEYTKNALQVAEELADDHSFLFTFEENTKATLLNFYENYIWVVSYPDFEPLHRFDLPDDLLFENLTPINDRFWLLNVSQWRHFLFDSHTMSLKEEIIIEGYEPKANEDGIIEGSIDTMKYENGKIFFTIREFFGEYSDIKEKYQWGTFKIEELLSDE